MSSHAVRNGEAGSMRHESQQVYDEVNSATS